MKFKDYVIDHIFSIICFLITGLLIFTFLWLIETSMVFILLVELIMLATFVISIVWDYNRRRNYYNQLFKLLEQLDQKTLLAEIMTQPHFLDGQILSIILRRNNKYQNDQLAEMENQNREYRDYLDTWVHEIKTPITSSRLIVENEKNPTTLRIDDELRKIDGYVEQVLYYTRSTAIEKDFKVEKTTLKVLVNMALKVYSKPLIQAGGKLHMECLDTPICADTKSCAFIIGQIISNAIKYRQEDFQLTFCSKIEKNCIKLIISDNGIGISPSDLSRVFDKGFTGENGRRFNKSTGIGLYLCKKLCNKMNIDLFIESVQSKSTAVTLCFPIESLLQEAGI